MMRLKGWAVGACLFVVAGNAFADGPTATGGTAQSNAPAVASDIVRLKDGSILRGTISEQLAGRSVTIVTLAGKSHEFAMTDVDYAGPESADPSRKPVAPAASASSASAAAPASPQTPESEQVIKPYVTVVGKAAQLHLESAGRPLTFHRQVASVRNLSAYEPLCTTPCDIELPAGTEKLALSLGDSATVPAGGITFPAGKSTLVGSYTSHSGLRIVGWVVMLTGTIGGTALILNDDTFGIGMGALVAGLVGIPFVFISDSADLRLRSGALPPERRSAAAPGLHYSGSF